MNRRPANSQESEDSGSDWDTTIAESPTHLGPSQILAPVALKTDVNDEYAKIIPKPRLGYQDMNGSIESANKKSSDAVPRQEMQQTKGGSQLISPPPHMTTFQSSLSDYSVVHNVPDIPSRGYEGKGKLYTVPESDTFSSPQTNLANWDDSDAEEQVLKELQKNLAKDKQRHLTATRDKKVTLAGVDKISTSVDNHAYVASPKETRSSESVIEKWSRSNEVKFGKNTENNQKYITMTGDISSPSQFRLPPNHSACITPPLVAKTSCGKKCVFYFEEGNPHFVEVEEDDVNAYLSPKVDEIEKIFRRVWREVFAVVRVVTSIFVLFVAELILFLAHHIVRPLVLDSLTAVGDYVLKPFLALLFNAVIQPVLALVWNIFNSLYQASEPLVKLLGSILMQVAIVLKAFRLFVIQWNTRSSGYRQELEVV